MQLKRISSTQSRIAGWDVHSGKLCGQADYHIQDIATDFVYVWCSDTRHVMQQEIVVSNGKIILHLYAGNVQWTTITALRNLNLNWYKFAAEWTRNLQSK